MYHAEFQNFWPRIELPMSAQRSVGTDSHPDSSDWTAAGCVTNPIVRSYSNKHLDIARSSMKRTNCFAKSM